MSFASDAQRRYYFATHPSAHPQGPMGAEASASSVEPTPPTQPAVKSERQSILDAYAAQGIDAMGGKDGGFYVRGRGWVSLRDARKDTGIDMAVKRGPRQKSSEYAAYGDAATMVMMFQRQRRQR